MRVRLRPISFLLTILAVSAAAAGPLPQLTGTTWWEGAINTPGTGLAVVVSLTRQADGSWKGTIDIPAQGAQGLPLTGIAVQGTSVAFEIAGVPGKPSFAGLLAPDGATISGTFTQGGANLTFKLNKRDGPAARRIRPQEPTKPYPYDEEDVTYSNRAAGLTFAGTLTLPRSPRPAPAVLLITGSGAEDRDETVFGHKPFLVLADYLTRRGVAVLRVDDRGVGGSGGSASKATCDDFAGDVVAGVEYLKGRREIDAKRIGLIGHSEGGLIAPIAATRSRDVAFIVLMAGPGLTGEEILYLQGALILKASGASDAAVAASRAQQERVFAILKTEPDAAAAEQKLRAIGVQQVERVSNPWFRFFLTYDPRPTLA